MDVAGIVLSATQTLLQSLECSELQETISIFGYKSQLDELRHTVTAVQAVLLDAEAKQELSHETQNWLEELKYVVFEADDLLDEFVTLAQQNKVLDDDGSFLEKVYGFFSYSSNPLTVAYRMSRGVDEIRNKLDAIAYNTQFSFKHDPEPIRKRRPETCSYVDSGDIIGREDDLEKIVSMMLDSNAQRDVSFLTIVGMGGLGKTALAQLVLNNQRVKSAFPLTLWACVSDQGQQQLDVKDILCKILASAGQSHEHSHLENVQKQLRDQLSGKKYLLVLDDVWSEKRDQWLNLEKYLIGGQRGSWVLVTTRSLETAKIIGDGRKHELQGLSEENSWCLFERMAFGLQSPIPPDDDLVKIGQDIVRGCARVPLAIRVAGSLLYGQDKSQWLKLAKIPLASRTDIMPILKLSYHNLEPSLKSCFSYCALFPKDYEIKKEMLISLWMAQGFIVPSDERQDIEEAAEEYFSILLRRCFFQDINRFTDGDVRSFKIHDLMHDVAQMVTKQEICSTNNLEGSLDNKVRHLSVTINKVTRWSFDKSHIRTYLNVADYYKLVKINAFMANCICLRALDLSYASIKTLPESIGELLHLRYLDLSCSHKLEVLPKSITKLCNLQTLILSGCFKLKELPKELSRLVKLRTLLTDHCSELTCFPKGMGELTSLCKLRDFIVGGEGSDSTTKQWLDGLEDLKAMKNLKGRLDIKFKWPKNGVKVGDSRNAECYLSNKEHLKGVTFLFSYEEVDGGVDTVEASRFMEQLQPYSNLERLEVQGYRGVSMPGWIILLPKLVHIQLVACRDLEFMPPDLGKLQHLKELRLEKLPKLEYIEIIPSSLRSEVAQGVSIFPSLEIFVMKELPKLKALGDDLHLLEDNKNVQLRLIRLIIVSCPELTCIPLCLKVDHLQLFNFNKRLKILSKSSSIPIPTLRKVFIDNVMWLKSLPMVAFQSLESLSLFDDEVESLEELEEVFRNCSSSLQTLSFYRCEKLRSVCGGLQHLAALKSLKIERCPNVMLAEEKEDGRPWPWRSLHHSLRNLTFWGLPQLVSLPDWMQSLSALEVLRIWDCERLESLPHWMPKLTSLKLLCLRGCSESLKSRCQKDPLGEDWPYIQHIPNIQISCKRCLKPDWSRCYTKMD